MEKISVLSSKEFAKKLDENLFSVKNFKKIHLFCVFWLILSPMIETLFWTFGIDFNMVTQSLCVAVFFCVVKAMELCFNFRQITFKGNLTDLLIVCLFAWFLTASFVNAPINFYFFIAISYFLIFALVLNVDKKYYKPIAVVFSIEMILDSILGLIDLHNKFIPGFDVDDFAISMQFDNPNWSGFVMIIAGVLILWFIINSEKIWQKGLWFAGFAILNLALFVGGSYAPEFSLVCCELAILIYYWIKNKKCPIWTLSALLLTIFISFFVWFIPAFREASTANANFFYESLAVIDGKLKTHLVEDISTLFNKLFGWNIIGSVAGSDGWGRNNFKAMAYKAIFKDAKSFLFGYGSGYLHTEIRVHDCHIGLWLIFGTPAFLLYLVIFVSLLVRFIRVKKTDKSIIKFMVFVMILFEMMFCCIEPYCYVFFIILVAFLYKELYSLSLKSELAKKEVNGKESEEYNKDVEEN